MKNGLKLKNFKKVHPSPIERLLFFGSLFFIFLFCWKWAGGPFLGGLLLRGDKICKLLMQCAICNIEYEICLILFWHIQNLENEHFLHFFAHFGFQFLCKLFSELLFCQSGSCELHSGIEVCATGQAMPFCKFAPRFVVGIFPLVFVFWQKVLRKMSKTLVCPCTFPPPPPFCILFLCFFYMNLAGSRNGELGSGNQVCGLWGIVCIQHPEQVQPWNLGKRLDINCFLWVPHPPVKEVWPPPHRLHNLFM